MKQDGTLTDKFVAPSAKKQAKRSSPPATVTLRLTEEERAMLETLALGSSMSAYVRKCVFAEQETTRKAYNRPEPVSDKQALAQVLGLLGGSRIANNLNQLAFHANSGSLAIDQEVVDKINEAYAHICVLRSELLKALGSKRLDEWGQSHDP